MEKGKTMKRVMLVLLLIMMLFAGSLSTQAQGNPPYIYYFDETLHALVIEQADGSDRHLLGEGIFPESANEMENFGVLPSGEWLYWNSITIRNAVRELTEAQPVVVNVNGESVPFVEQLIGGKIWGSPTDDLL